MKDLSEDERTSLKAILSLNVPYTAVCDLTDDRVALGLEFLERINAEKLKGRLGALTAAGKLIVTKGPALASGGISVSREEDTRSGARSILRQLISSVDEGAAVSLKGDFMVAFAGFLDNKGSFGPAGFPRDFELLILSVEARLGVASNESGLKFPPEAFTEMLDVSDVDLKDCREDIALIKLCFEEVGFCVQSDYFTSISEEQRESLNEGWLSARGAC
ncbi:hypothetical protein KKH56_08905 [bacterium]|nr:hypothetical protein [bacterium]MBU1967557.1 hypothetical protein [Patescibacteria group bacterium]